MHRRLTILCLLMVAGALLIATAASATDLPFQFASSGQGIITGQLEGLPLLHVTSWSTSIGPNSLHLQSWFNIWEFDPTTGAVSDGSTAWKNDQGDVLYGRISGQIGPPLDEKGTANGVFDIVWLGGTGAFAGARGTAHVTSQSCPDNPLFPVHVTVTDVLCTGKVTVPALHPKLEPVQFHMDNTLLPGTGGLEPEAFPPLFYQEVQATGISGYWGTYAAARRGPYDAISGACPGGFLTIQVANGDLCYSYYEGQVNVGPDGSISFTLWWWITGGTGEFKKATGYLTGVGYPSDGHESYLFTGDLSPGELKNK